MEFRIADSFIDSLARLTRDEQKAVKTTAFDLQVNHANPGMQFHRLDKAKDKNFWSVRVGSDIRVIVHKTGNSLLLCYVNHHDKAYDWAERRRLEVHPNTGAAQFVELRETVQEILIPSYIQASPKTKEKLFSNVSENELLELGVPLEWLKDVKDSDEDTLLVIAEHLPSEAAEALLDLATGGKKREIDHFEYALPLDPFRHPDALRRFRVLKNVEELQLALDSPWDKWAVFLHPEQEQIVRQHYSGPAGVSGSAGTGKTIVAVHRAVQLVKSDAESRVLLTTLSGLLANSLKVKVRRLISGSPALSERLDVYSISDIGLRLYKASIGSPTFASDEQIRNIIKSITSEIDGLKFAQPFLESEWRQVVDTWQIGTWEEYRDVRRLGRKTRLPEQQRAILWQIFLKVNEQLKEKGLLTWSGLFKELTEFYSKNKNRPYDNIVADESQDFGVAQLRFLSVFGEKHENALFFAGDLGQRIFQQVFSWKSLGIDIRGRSSTLRVNYRTSHQIRKQADQLLGVEVTDGDSNVEVRHAISIFNGLPPDVKILRTIEDERVYVSSWIKSLITQIIAPHEIGVFVRSEIEIDRAVDAVKSAKTPYKILDESMDAIGGQIAISTMHLAKGLEFKAVIVMACDDEVIPLQERVESVVDDADLEDVYNTERQLLYVACTRARDFLLVTAVTPGSEFLQDLE